MSGLGFERVTGWTTVRMIRRLERNEGTKIATYSCKTRSAVPRSPSRSRTIPLSLSREDFRKGNIAFCLNTRNLALRLSGAGSSRHLPKNCSSLAVPSPQQSTHCFTCSAIAEEDEIFGRISSRAKRLLCSLSIFLLASLMFCSWFSHES